MVVSEELEARLALIEARLDKLRNLLQQTCQESPNNASTDSRRLAAITHRLDGLTRRLDEIEEQMLVMDRRAVYFQKRQINMRQVEIVIQRSLDQFVQCGEFDPHHRRKLLFRSASIG